MFAIFISIVVKDSEENRWKNHNLQFQKEMKNCKSYIKKKHVVNKSSHVLPQFKMYSAKWYSHLRKCHSQPARHESSDEKTDIVKTKSYTLKNQSSLLYLVHYRFMILFLKK